MSYIISQGFLHYAKQISASPPNTPIPTFTVVDCCYLLLHLYTHNEHISFKHAFIVNMKIIYPTIDRTAFACFFSINSIQCTLY